VEELSSNAFHEATGTYDVGNPALHAEVNEGVDGILRLDAGRVTGQLAGFYNDIRHYITPDIVGDTLIDGGDGLIAVPLNRISQGDATLRGLEGRLEAVVRPQLVLGAMGDMVRGRLKSGEPLPYMPAARLGALARWNNGVLSLNTEFRHAFAQDRVPAATNEDDPSGIPTTAYDLLDLSAGYTFTTAGQVSTIILRVDNTLDERYVDATSRLKTFAFNPGRNVALVYRLTF
jgi:iron complex outermembrane receptor protein